FAPSRASAPATRTPTISPSRTSRRPRVRRGPSRTARAPRRGARWATRGRPPISSGRADPPIAANLDRKLALLGQMDAAARGLDPRVRQVIATLGSEDVVVVMATPSGGTVGDVRPLTRLNVTVIVEDGAKREIGTYGGGGRVAFDFFLEQ